MLDSKMERYEKQRSNQGTPNQLRDGDEEKHEIRNDEIQFNS